MIVHDFVCGTKSSGWPPSVAIDRVRWLNLRCLRDPRPQHEHITYWDIPGRTVDSFE
jgi:hypothetical protein